MHSYVDEGGVINLTNTRPENRQYRVLIADPASPSETPVFSKSDRGDYDQLIDWQAKSFDVDPRLIKAVIMVESNGNPKALSKKGAQGLMQIMPSTARALALQHPFDPDENIGAGTKYLRFLHDRFMGNLDLVLAAYNAGPETVAYHNMSVPSIKETVQYVERVKKYCFRLVGL
jgi:soluble lytic murein transglycosylase-like protein